jgi:hypothetical protein
MDHHRRAEAGDAGTIAKEEAVDIPRAAEGLGEGLEEVDLDLDTTLERLKRPDQKDMKFFREGRIEEGNEFSRSLGGLAEVGQCRSDERQGVQWWARELGEDERREEKRRKW